MICKNCGSQVNPAISFCPNCNQVVDISDINNMKSNNDMQSINNVPQQPVQPMNSLPQQPMQQKKKNKLKIILPIIFIVTLIAVLCIIFLPKLKEKFGSLPNELNISNGTRTIMIYMIGSNLESQYGQGTLDVEEIIDSEFDTDYLNIIVYAGGASEWQNEFDADENAIYEIEGEKVQKVKTFKQKNMTKSSTLTEFIDYVYANYDTDLYSLILWDHGGGPMMGYGHDENYENSVSMSLTDLDKAINDSQLMKETKFEFIGFDACLMASIEIANILKEESNYLIASSEVIPGQGWDYTFLSEITGKTSSEDFGKIIINYYYDYYKELKSQASYYGYSYEPQITLSLIDLGKIDEVVVSIDELFKNMDSSISVSSYSKISRGASRAVMYGYDESSTMQIDLIDLYGLMDELDGYETDEVKNAINKSIIYHKSNIDDCYGISIYFPITTKAYYNFLNSEYSYDDIIVSENYSKFLNKYVGINSGDRLVKSDITSLTPVTNNYDISVELPDDVVENYENGNYIVFKEMQDGSLLPIYKSRDVVLNDNTMSATVANRIISVSDGNGENVNDLIAIEVSRDENSVTYALIGILHYWDEADYFDTHKMEIIEIYLKVDNTTNQGEIIDIKSSSNTDNVVGKITYNLNDWTAIEFLSSSYFLYDENGNKLAEWQKSGTMYGTEIIIKDGYKFFASELSDENKYYYMFQVRDTQGNLYETNLVEAK